MFAGFISHPSSLPENKRQQARRSVACLLLTALALAGCQGDVESRLAEVRSLQSAGQYEPSIAPLRKILASESNQPEANYRLGIALVQTGRPTLAVWPLQKASETDEFRVQAGVLLASTLLANGTLDDAARAATKVLASQPDNIGALFTRGHANLRAGHPERTLEDADQLLKLRPDDIAAISLRGAALVDLERVDEAEQTWRDIYEMAKKSGDENQAARNCAALATFFRTQKQDDKAQTVFEECLRDFPTHALLQQWVSDFYVETGQPEKSIKVWKQAVAQTPEDLGLRAKLADLLYGQGHVEEAAAVVQESVALFDTPEAWRMLSGFQRKIGQPKAARTALEQSLERTRSVSPGMRFALADMMIEEGDLDGAQKIADELEEPSYRSLLNGAILLARKDAKGALVHFDEGLRLWPNNAGARYLAGRAADELGDGSRAAAEYREAVRVGETETDAALRLAEIYNAAGQPKAALQFAERQIKNRPYVDPTAHVIAARACIQLEQWDRAEGILKNLKARDPESPIPYVEFANLKRSAEGPQAAIDFILKSKLDLTKPANSALLGALCGDYVSVGKPEQALARVEAAVKAHPQELAFLDLQVRSLMHAGRADAAREVLAKAEAIDANYAPVLELRGMLLRQAGQLDEAISHFERAAAASPYDAEYVYLAAQTLFMKQDTQAGTARLRAAIELDPSHVRANNDLAWLLANAGSELDRALELARVAVRLGRSADTLDTLGFVHLKRGDAEEAVTILSKALEARPDSPSIEYHLGAALAAKGDKEQARAMLSKALSRDGFPEAEAAKAELARLQSS